MTSSNERPTRTKGDRLTFLRHRDWPSVKWRHNENTRPPLQTMANFRSAYNQTSSQLARNPTISPFVKESIFDNSDRMALCTLRPDQRGIDSGEGEKCFWLFRAVYPTANCVETLVLVHQL